MHRFPRIILSTGLLAAYLMTGCSTDATATEVATNPSPTETVTLSPTFTPSPLPTSTAEPSPFPSSSPIDSNTPEPVQAEPITTSFPAEHYIANISGHKQFFSLGCETAAAKDWANYFGFDFNEFEFQYSLPVSDNPDFGFVGDVNSVWGQVPPYAYGVHAGPIADLLNAYSIPAKAVKGMTVGELKQQLAQDKPVITWVIGNVVGGVPYEYTDSKGNTTIVAAYEHIVIATGYSETHIRYMNNGKLYDTPIEVFLNSWSVLGYMAVIAGK